MNRTEAMFFAMQVNLRVHFAYHGTIAAYGLAVMTGQAPAPFGVVTK